MSTFKDFMDSELAATAAETQNELIRKAYANRKSVQMLNVDVLVPSQHNRGRSMDGNYISAVADSIEAYGTLIEPVTVYPLGNGTYCILSGHVRTAAWKQLQERYPDVWGRKQIPCLIVDKPQDELAEMESLSKANVHRSTRKDRDNEIVIANNAWTKYIEPKPLIKARYVARYAKLFEDANKENSKFLNDPSEFKRMYFRPRIWYIREQTGVELTDSMIKAILKKGLIDDADELLHIKRPTTPNRKPTKVTSVKLAKKIKAITPDLHQFFEQNRNEDDSEPSERAELLTALTELASYIQSHIENLQN